MMDVIDAFVQASAMLTTFQTKMQRVHHFQKKFGKRFVFQGDKIHISVCSYNENL